jgi:hypothetical protein
MVLLVSYKKFGHMLRAGRPWVRFPMRWIFFNLPNLTSRSMTLGSTQPLTEMCTGIFLWCKGRPARKADNRAAICEPTV